MINLNKKLTTDLSLFFHAFLNILSNIDTHTNKYKIRRNWYTIMEIDMLCKNL